ncbi:MAG TPA: hypothetical protein VFF31_05155 [Blastocatellia bacterium]|nr:hypothetical protein [Blastocatellia bacterium]
MFTAICGLLLSVELVYRAWLYLHNCDPACYNIALFAKLDAFNRDTIYRFLARDPDVGYSLADGTLVVDEPGWNGARITIHQGVRVNPDFTPTSGRHPILAIGGSFVFGDKVSDDETWPAILERRLNRRVVNGGVSGYGPVQAVLHAEKLLKSQAYSLVILSIVVFVDLPRDRYVNFLRFHRPAVIRDDWRLRHTTFEESGKVISENFACAHPWVPEMFSWSHMAKRFFLRFGYDGRCTNITHPRAATVDEIREFAIERMAALPVNNKVILVHIPRHVFGGFSIEEARKIADAAGRHGVRVIDVYNDLKNKPLLEILKSENEVLTDLIVRKIAAMAP